MNIGEYVKDKLKQQGRLQSWLSDQLKIEESTLSRKLNENRFKSAEYLIKIAIVLDIDLEELKREYKNSNKMEE